MKKFIKGTKKWQIERKNNFFPKQSFELMDIKISIILILLNKGIGRHEQRDTAKRKNEQTLKIVF
ncbi:hypothetical protein BpHYR1_005076 [Brachionus plicatilis]|uniref:Uncharacterized protein n=1 Tax=Brachionus plicatilis TaxID=10195 RepID=A0A3M7QZ28_BRAPC|nr:hypothetical protein BpHYR1_005076 [Brachionus plicatilis]